MSKNTIRVIKDSKHVGTVPREVVAEAVRTLLNNKKTKNSVANRDAVHAPSKR